jgi:hypothetical protein
VVFALGAVACADAPQRRGTPAFMPGADDDGDGGDDDGGSATLDVDPIDTSGVFPEEGDGGDEGFSCDPEEVQECPCPDGPGTGIQNCSEGMWGPCLCDDAGSTGGDDSGLDSGPADTGEEGGEAEATGEPPPPPTEVCFPGADGNYDTCLDVHAFDPDAPPAGYAYPAAIGGDPNYRRPIAYIDLDTEDPNLALAPNFTLGEFAQAHKGRWGIVQPHAVEAVQGLRDDLGALVVNSGYRSPDYNASVGGAGSSRHMYGDGFDLDPVNVTIGTLETACTGAGGMLVEYETHVHCDWRFDDVDEAFFGPADQAAPQGPSLTAMGLGGELQHSGRVFWTTDEGFDEGVPVRRWTAWDHDGRELATGRGPMFVAPAGTAKVAVRIGAAIERAATGAW